VCVHVCVSACACVCACASVWACVCVCACACACACVEEIHIKNEHRCLNLQTHTQIYICFSRRYISECIDLFVNTYMHVNICVLQSYN